MSDYVSLPEWEKFPNFSRSEFVCRFTDKCEMDFEFIEVLQEIRDEYKKPIIINSGYRDRKHPLEIDKATPGEHTLGLAEDIRCSHLDAIKILEIAIKKGIRRIGLAQKGITTSRFIHLGMADKNHHFPVSIWTY
jgi:uncharacterized protein YcbK (DUF882 family)